MKKPNILWLIAEDMCPNLGCYGDIDAITPRIDTLAEEGIRFTNTSSCGPVCSAARTTLALGMYPSSVGTGNHRSCVELPDYVKIFSEYMQEVGYFTAINKTDYNFKLTHTKDQLKGWDTNIKSDYFKDTEDLAQVLADMWNDKKAEQPFFFMHTFAITHQSKYGYPSTPDKHREQFIPRIKPEEFRDRNKLTIPTYHPDNSDTREIWGQYHETITSMDRMVGETIDKLKEDGIYEDTIIFFFGDNGMGIPSGKFSMWNEGISVPLVVRVPDQYKHLVKNPKPGRVSHKPVTFVDFAPTALQLAGADIPEYMQGDSFLLPKKTEKEYTYNFRNRIDSSCDLVRSIKNDKYLYIRNFYPQKGWRFSPYIAISAPYFTKSWEEHVKLKGTESYNRLNSFYNSRKPVEELYDLNEDPYQMNNIAENSSAESLLLKMREELQQSILLTRDGGLFPEQELKKLAINRTSYDIIQDDDLYPLEDIVNICNKINKQCFSELEAIALMNHDNPVIRYWVVQGIYAKGIYSKEIQATILKALEDNSEMVQLAAAETILMLTDIKEDVVLAKEKLIAFLMNDEDVLLPLEAADCLDRLGVKGKDLVKYTAHLSQDGTVTNEKNVDRYVQAVVGLAKYYAEKMDMPHDYIDPEDWYIKRLLELRRLKKKLIS